MVFTRFARCHAHFERSYYRALRELRALQTNRALRRQLQPATAYELPILVSVAEFTKRTHRSGGAPPRDYAPRNVARETAVLPPRPNGAAAPPGNFSAHTPSG